MTYKHEWLCTESLSWGLTQLDFLKMDWLSKLDAILQLVPVKTGLAPTAFHYCLTSWGKVPFLERWRKYAGQKTPKFLEENTR